MKILFIRHTPLGKPGAMAVHAIPSILSELGHSVVIVAKKGGDDSFLTQAGVTTIEIASQNFLDWTRKLWRIANNIQPDIIHVFIHIGCGLYPILLKPVCHAKFILDIRSPLLSTGIRRNLTRLKNYIELSGYDSITAHSIESAWTVLGKRTDIQFVPPGVFLDKIPMRRHVTGQGDIIKAVYTGSLNKSRCILKMVSAFLRSCETVPVSLDIYGTGDDEFAIKNVVSHSRYASHVRMMGIVDRGKLYSLLGNYDIGLAYIPQHTVYDPAPPLKTVEFLAAELAVVATRTPGNELFIRDEENGILVGDTDAEFAEGIIRIAKNISLRKKIMTCARQSIVQYDWGQIVNERLLPTYEKKTY